MGEKSTNEPGKLTETERGIEERDRQGTNNSSTETASKKRGRPPGRTSEKEIVSELVNVEPKIISIDLPGADQQDEPQKKKAGRPAGTQKKTPAKNAKVDSTQIQFLLATVSGLIASRPGFEIWNLSPDESKQIAEPLAKILSKNSALANVSSEHADAFALIVACFMVFLPKIIMHQAMKPKKAKQGENVNYGIEKSTKPQQQERTNERNDRSNVRPSTSTAKNVNQNFGGQLHDLIPVIGGI